MVRLGPITKEQFDTWFTPEQAIERLGEWTFDTKARWIAGRLESGLIKAAAAAHRAPRDRDAKIEIVEIPGSLWKHWACLADEDFWDTGDITFYSTTTGYDRHLIGRFHDVRFEPHGFPNALASAAASVPAQSAEKPTVSRAELSKWHEVFKGVHPDAPEALALQSAVAMFPDKHVPRQYVRDLRGPQKRGKPPSRHK